VSLVEDRLVLHTQRGELIHVEEAPVVDLRGPAAPVHEPIVLCIDQCLQALASGFAGIRIGELACFLWINVRELQVSGQRRRVQRNALLEVGHAGSFTIDELHGQLATSDDGIEIIAQDGENQFSVAVARSPVDVEPPCMARALSVGEHVVPIAILGTKLMRVGSVTS
jgi:hypothetical protein